MLRKLADRCGLTAALEAALTQRGMFPQARARIRANVWQQIQDAGGFPWLEIAGMPLAG